MMRLLIAIWVALFLMTGALCATTISSVRDLGTSAKTRALGAVEGLHDQANVLFENPAGMTGLYGSNYTLFYTKLADEQTQFISLAATYEYRATHFGFGYISKTIPSLDYTGENVLEEFFVNTTFDVFDRYLTAGVARQLSDQLSLGASFHYYQQDLYVTRGSGVNLNLGLRYDTEKTRWSFSGKNLMKASELSYSNGYGSASFPYHIVVSVAHDVFSILTLYSQLDYIPDFSIALKSAGLELALPKTSDALVLYAGWKEISVASEVANRFSLGLGLDLGSADIQFAYEPTDYTANNSQYGISLNIRL